LLDFVKLFIEGYKIIVMTEKEFREKAELAKKTLQEYLKLDGWTQTKKSKDGAVIFYRSSTEFEGYLYKGEFTLDASPATVFHYVDPLPDAPRAKWDSNMKKIEILEWIERPHLRINRACTGSACMGVISPRDFIDVIITAEDDFCYSTNAMSIKYDKCPEEKKYVRGWNYPCGLLLLKLPNEPNKTKLVSLIQPDIGGMLPRALVDGAIPSSMTAFFSELKEALVKDKQLTS